MRRTCVIKLGTGLVENVIELGGTVPANCEEATQPPEGFTWIEHATAGIGWTYSAGVFTAPATPEAAPAPKRLSVDGLASLLKQKGLVSAAEIAAAME